MHFSEIPILGVGLAADVSGVRPNYRSFLGGPADTIDYLSFGAHYIQEERVRYYIDDLVRSSFPIVFHPINFNVALGESEDEHIVEGIRSIAQYCKAAWTGQDIAIWTYRARYLGALLIPVILDEQSSHEVAAKVKRINQLMPCPFLIENPPIGFSLERLHLLDFMKCVSEESDCGIVLDIGHLIGYQQATGRVWDDMPLDTFPFHRVVEIHLAGLQFSKVGEHTNIIDQHSYPVHEACWEFVERHIHRMINLKGITLEQEFCDDELVLKHLRRARILVQSRGVFTHAGSL